MSSMDILDKMTQVSLDALWKIKVQECIEASLSSVLIYPAKETEYDCILYNMEEGILPPKPIELPMPPLAWLI